MCKDRQHEDEVWDEYELDYPEDYEDPEYLDWLERMNEAEEQELIDEIQRKSYEEPY